MNKIIIPIFFFCLFFSLPVYGIDYCLVKNGEVINKPQKLSVNWKNISNFNALSNSDLKTLGWFPAAYNASNFNPTTHKKLSNTYEILPDKINVVTNFRNKTPVEIAAEAVINQAQIKEEKIRAKIREIAIRELIKDGELEE